MQGLFVSEVPQFGDLREFLPDALRKAEYVVVLWAGGGYFNYRRRAEIQDLTNQIAGIEREMRSRELARQRVAEFFLQIAERNRCPRAEARRS